MSSTTPYLDRADAFRLAFRARARAGAPSALADRFAVSTYWGFAALLVVAVVAPLFLLGVPPLTDFPAHLARVALLSDAPLDPLLSRAWQIDFRLLPNLAMDVFVVLVAPFVGPELGLKIFLSVGAALWVTGAMLLYRALWRQWGVQPLFAIFFVINPVFTSGFVNSYVGMGLALTAAGAWALAPKRPAWLLLTMSGVAVVLLICHLMAVAVLALLIGGLEIGRLWRESASASRIAKSVAEGAIVFLPAALAWAFVFEHGHDGGLEFKWLNNMAALFVYSSNAGAVDHNVLPSAALLGAQFLAWRFGRLQIARTAIPVVVLTMAAMLLCPSVALSGAFIHVRLPALVCIVILVTGRIVVEPHWVKPALAALSIATLASGALEFARWRPGAATIQAIRDAANAHIEAGARVGTAMVDVRRDYALSRAVSPIAIDRSAFLPDFFTYRGQSTIIVKDAYRRIAAENAVESAIPSMEDAIRLLGPQRPLLGDRELPALRPYLDMACDLDYLYVVGEAPESAAAPPSLQRIAAGDRFVLFRIVAPAERHCPARG